MSKEASEVLIEAIVSHLPEMLSSVSENPALESVIRDAIRDNKGMLPITLKHAWALFGVDCEEHESRQEIFLEINVSVHPLNYHDSQKQTSPTRHPSGAGPINTFPGSPKKR